MSTPTEGTSTAHNMIHVQWITLTSPNDGGSSVTSYNLYWDQGTGDWTTVVG
jgi:hypothetical protein